MRRHTWSVLILLLFGTSPTLPLDNTDRWTVGTIGSAIKMMEGGRDHSTVEQWFGISIRRGLSERVSVGLDGAYGWVRARKLGVDQFNSSNTHPFKTNLLPLTAHVYYHLRTEGRIIPHFSFGAGVIRWEIRDLRNTDRSTFSNGTKIRDEMSPAYTAGFGIDFMLGQKFALTTSVRYNRMLKGDEDTSGLRGFNGLSGDPNKAVAEVRLGFKILFSGNPDKDGDGLLTKDEQSYGTNPEEPDTDSDGIDDFSEVYTFKTNPLKKDSDSDSISDIDEIEKYETDANLSDTDGDGLDDGKELKFYQTDPLKADTDGDGLKDSEEVNVHKTDPLVADSDDDGLTDGEEVKLHNSSPISDDTDGDGLTDRAEVTEHGTHPNKSDTDAGSVSDAIEIARGTNPFDPNDDVIEDAFKKGPQILEGVEFASGSAEITPESEPILKAVLKNLKEYPSTQIVIHGYTDNTGKRSTNMRLSQQRAEAVKQYFEDRGIQPERIKAIGLGPDNPIASNATPEGRQENRRIEFVIVQ